MLYHDLENFGSRSSKGLQKKRRSTRGEVLFSVDDRGTKRVTSARLVRVSVRIALFF